MKLNKLLEKRKSAILKAWFEFVVDTYPDDTSKFLKRQKDPFANPVGSTTMDGLTGLFDELIGNMNAESITSFLDPIIRIRAVQSFTPSGAVGFAFALKKIVRERISKDMNGDVSVLSELASLDEKIDIIGLSAFDIYMRCREQIYNIRATEQHNRTFKAFEKAGLVREI
jgi:hypothetical protein